MLDLKLFLLISSIFSTFQCEIIPDLPAEHYPYYLTTHPETEELCDDVNPETNLYKTFCDVISKSGRKCWGYEEQLGFACPPNAITKMPGKDLLGVANLSQKISSLH